MGVSGGWSARRWFGEAGFQVGNHLGQQAGVLLADRLRAELVDAGDFRVDAR